MFLPTVGAVCHLCLSIIRAYQRLSVVLILRGIDRYRRSENAIEARGEKCEGRRRNGKLDGENEYGGPTRGNRENGDGFWM